MVISELEGVVSESSDTSLWDSLENLILEAKRAQIHSVFFFCFNTSFSMFSLLFEEKQAQEWMVVICLLEKTLKPSFSLSLYLSI